MANRKVSVYKQVRVGDMWVKCPPAMNKKNHKVENDKVLVGGKMEVHPEGNWGLLYYEGGKRKWQKIGPKYQAARDAADVKELALRGRAKGLVVEEKGAKTLLRVAMNVFLEDIRISRSPKTYALLKYDLEEFRDWVKKDYVEDLTRKDLMAFKHHILSTPEVPRNDKPHLVPKLRSERTAANKCGEVNSFYRSHFGLKPGEGLGTGKDWKWTEKNVKVYSQEELDMFFAECNPKHDLMFDVFLKAGLRKQELQFLEWPDIVPNDCVIKVTEKRLGKDRDYKFKPKMGTEREVTVPKELIERLMEWKKTAKHKLVFPTRSGKPDKKIWDGCQRIARRAGFTEATFHVHRFRATFASYCLQRGMDLKSVQGQLGHTNIESTSRYLAGLEGKQKRDKVESIWGPQVVPPAQMPHVYADLLGQ